MVMISGRQAGFEFLRHMLCSGLVKSASGTSKAWCTESRWFHLLDLHFNPRLKQAPAHTNIWPAGEELTHQLSQSPFLLSYHTLTQKHCFAPIYTINYTVINIASAVLSRTVYPTIFLDPAGIFKVPSWELIWFVFRTTAAYFCFLWFQPAFVTIQHMSQVTQLKNRWGNVFEVVGLYSGYNVQKNLKVILLILDIEMVPFCLIHGSLYKSSVIQGDYWKCGAGDLVAYLVQSGARNAMVNGLIPRETKMSLNIPDKNVP